jgi:hypothetical protein
MDESRFRVSENRIAKRLFTPEREVVTSGWRKLRNEQLHNLYFSTDIRV